MADEIRLMAPQPFSDCLPQRQMFSMASLMIAERLSRFVEVVVVCCHLLRILLANVVHHCVDFMGQERPQLLTNNLDAKSVNRTNDRGMLVLEGCQSCVNVVTELPCDNP